ncbi:hypothetical protein FHY13_001076 [Xanthomonas arboricola]|uniref:hypothetical protein n=1 Tax=Xanthomonas euroxanthea TaxID=2259622 RepID=UPI0017F75B8E|nr:hypothetical protein [Xanthomonas euroxanthea]MBB3812770.1 hypothetical protein [Xanthomonas euroxanthea]
MKLSVAFFLILPCALSSCGSEQECSSASFDLHKKTVIAYVERSSYPKLQGATEADMSFKEGDKTEVFEGMGIESPRYEGRVIAAVWDDPEMIKLAGKTLIGAELGKRYGVSDIPGFNPKSLREYYGSPHPRFDLH